MRRVLLSIVLLAALSLPGTEVINLGDTPWRFTRVITETSSLGSGLDVRCGKRRVAEANDQKLETRHTGSDTLLLDLLKISNASSVELLFAGDSVRQVNALIEISNDLQHWTTLHGSDQALTCHENHVNDITAVNNTGGYASVVTSTSLRVQVSGVRGQD